MLATSERCLLAGGIFRAILVSESHWLQPVLVLSVHWWPAPTCVGRVFTHQSRALEYQPGPAGIYIPTRVR